MIHEPQKEQKLINYSLPSSDQALPISTQESFAPRNQYIQQNKGKSNSRTHLQIPYEHRSITQLRDNQIEIRYYIFQNLQSIVNLIYSAQAIINYFEKDSNHPLINLSKNKVISQINLANITIYDLQVRNSNNKDDIEEMQECKEFALKVIKYATKNLNSDLQAYIQHYINRSLLGQAVVEQMPLQPQNYNHQLNIETMKEIFFRLVKSNRNVEELKQRKQYPLPTRQNIIARANQFQQQTDDILAKKFSKTEQFLPRPSQPISENQIQQISFAEYQKQIQQFKELKKQALKQQQTNRNWNSFICKDYDSSEYDPKILPQGPLTEVKVILLQCTCPNTCVCGGQQIRKWYHQHCGYPAFINSNGEIFCKNFLKNKECAGYFIQYAKFQCDEAKPSTTWQEYKNASIFLMALAQGQQSSEFMLDDYEKVEFVTNLNQQVFKRWNR